MSDGTPNLVKRRTSPSVLFQSIVSCGYAWLWPCGLVSFCHPALCICLPFVYAAGGLWFVTSRSQWSRRKASDLAKIAHDMHAWKGLPGTSKFFAHLCALYRLLKAHYYFFLKKKHTTTVLSFVQGLATYLAAINYSIIICLPWIKEIAELV